MVLRGKAARILVAMPILCGAVDTDVGERICHRPLVGQRIATSRVSLVRRLQRRGRHVSLATKFLHGEDDR